MASSVTGSVESCIASSGGNAEVALQCVSENVQTVTTDLENLAAGLDIFFLIFAASVMFFMQGGFAMLCAGCVRSKNVQNTIMKNLLDSCGAGLAFFSVGYAFAYGNPGDDGRNDAAVYTGEPVDATTTFIGNGNFFLIGVENYSFWLYQFTFAATAATIVAGTLAERCQMVAYLLYSTFLTAFVYPVIVHAVWSVNGFLTPLTTDPLFGVGVIDFAGSGVVHVTGGFTSLIASKILGPRKGRFDERKSQTGSTLEVPKKIEGHSSSLQALGTFILWFGWYGFNAGSIHQVSTANHANIASLAAVSTTLGAASGCVTALGVSALLALRRTGDVNWNLSDGLNGCLAGLVGITGGCGMFEPWASVLVGSIAALLYLSSSELLVKLRIDDAVDAIPVHLFGGLWGVIAVGFFASPRRLIDIYGHATHPGWFYSFTNGGSDASLLAANLVGLLFILAWVFFTMTPFFLMLSFCGWFRADSLEEIIGLDPGSGNEYQATGNVTSEHLEILRQQLDQRSGFANEDAPTEATHDDRFDINA